MTLDNDDATPNGGVGTTLGFTSNFINRLTKSRGQLESYVESNKRVADDYVTALRTIQVNEQQDIDNLIRQLKSLQYERGVVAAEEAGSDSGGVAVQRKELDKRQVLLQDELTLLKTKNHIEQSQLDEAISQEAIVRRKADSVRAKKEEIELARDTTVEDLTKGLLNYRFTGLTFKQSEQGALSFKFTKLVKDDHTREFNFTLKMDDSNDNYMLTNVNPTLDRTQTDILLTMLNADGKSGFHSFVVGMRKLFKETIR